MTVVRSSLVASLLTSLLLAGCGQAPSVTRVTPEPAVQARSTASSLTIDGAANYAAIERVVREASRSIWIESFHFTNDAANRPLSDLLIKRAKQGLQVRVLMDQIGNFRETAAPDGMLARLRAGGVDARTYDSKWMGVRGLNITHRKLYLADGDRGLTGGMNLTQDFRDERHDLLVEFRGDSVARDLHREFIHDWALAGGAELKLPPVAVSQSPNQVLVTSPLEERLEIREALYQALDDADQEVTVETMYLSDDGLCDRLIRAAGRGVKVRVIVPGANRSKPFELLNTRAANKLLVMGAQMRQYRHRYTHVKYFATEQVALFGSANGDSRAMNLNQELSVLVREPGLRQELDRRMFEVDWQQAAPIDHFPSGSWFEHPLTTILELIDYYI